MDHIFIEYLLSLSKASAADTEMNKTRPQHLGERGGDRQEAPNHIISY